jgi:hypothetical protein
LADDLTLEQATTMLDSVQALINASKALVADLVARTKATLQVETIADVLQAHEGSLRRSFVTYCRTCFRLQCAFEKDTPAKRKLFAAAIANPLCRNLPVTAFVRFCFVCCFKKLC